ncbi:MAG: single-stranded DNA-binding protein [Prochloraceae cyanobacterium]
MTPEQFDLFMQSQRELYKLNQKILLTQQKIAAKLEILINDLENDLELKDPDYQKNLADYQNFDWSSIGAKVIVKDSDGVSSVEWGGKIYKRRSPDNKFTPAIWFSRHDGEQYQKLITFKKIDPAEPISRKVLAQLDRN